MPKLQHTAHTSLHLARQITILGIESSCDDTSAAVIHNSKILANVTAGQEVHRHYGGVVPELASRAHQQHIVPVVDAALRQAQMLPDALSGIAYTQGPGLLGSLLVGSSFAKSMGQALGIPTYPIHHMRAHVLAHFIDDERMQAPPFPFLCLTVSGGHTQLLRVHSEEYLELLGETLDDAAGEAFDKGAKILGLPYPGGPLIDINAALGNPHRFELPISKVPGLNWSFSGLKTAFRNLVERGEREREGFTQQNLHDLCASLQYTIVRTLMLRVEEAVEATGIHHVAMAGGVSANSGLRKAFEHRTVSQGWHVYTLPMEYCTDNGAMIAMAGHFAHVMNRSGHLSDAACARWHI